MRKGSERDREREREEGEQQCSLFGRQTYKPGERKAEWSVAWGAWGDRDRTG